MRLFSDCAGKCLLCSANSCMAGRGDNYFSPASKEQLIKMLNTGKYKGSPENKDLTKEEINQVKGFLLMEYNYDAEKQSKRLKAIWIKPLII